MESKYKVGDKVRIKSLDWYNSNKDEDGEIGLHSDEYLFLEVMSEYCGKECEVSHVYPNGEYSLKGNGWIWNDWMFEDDTDNNNIQKRKVDESDIDIENYIHPFQEITNGLYETYCKKNRDYGNSFEQSLNKFGEISALIRISDKYNRLCSLITNKGQEVKDESIDDTILDMANYLIMWQMYRKSKK